MSMVPDHSRHASLPSYWHQSGLELSFFVTLSELAILETQFRKSELFVRQNTWFFANYYFEFLSFAQQLDLSMIHYVGFLQPS